MEVRMFVASSRRTRLVMSEMALLVDLAGLYGLLPALRVAIVKRPYAYRVDGLQKHPLRRLSPRLRLRPATSRGSLGGLQLQSRALGRSAGLTGRSHWLHLRRRLCSSMSVHLRHLCPRSLW